MNDRSFRATAAVAGISIAWCQAFAYHVHVLGLLTLRLSQPEERSAPLLLAPRLVALSMVRKGGWQEAPRRVALAQLDNAGRALRGELRRFAVACGLVRGGLADLDDHGLLARVRTAMASAELLALRPGRASSVPNEDAELRRLLAEINGKAGGRLSFQGRQYRLVIGDDLGKTPGRDRYEVVGQAEARAVLDGMVCERGTQAEPLRKAREKLSRDWRPPYSQAEGLVLLRQAPVVASRPKEDGPSLTPSQMKALLDAEKPVTFFARFVDEHGKAVTGFIGTLAHGSDPDTDMAFADPSFVKVAGLKGQEQAWLTLSDDANRDLVDALKERWQQIRGQVDEAWKAEERALAEVLLARGKLPELQLQSDKKHTFMLRPPVALARMHGMYFDTNKCFLLPSAVASLKRLVEIYDLHPDSELLIVGHTDTAGSTAYNLDLSADRADAMRAYLRDDADAWLAWYGANVREGKRWGQHEDDEMIDALVPEEDLAGKKHVAAFQAWHNGNSADAREPERERGRPKGWEELKVDGILGPKTRRQLILDYMNLDKTSLPEDTRVVTYGCGEHFPLASEEGDVDSQASDGENVPFDRRVEVFFFAKPFGILPAVPGVADGESPAQAIERTKDDGLYLEWRIRTTRHYAIAAEVEAFKLRLCDCALAPYAKRPFAFCMEGYPEIRGATDKDGFAIIEAPPAGAKGAVELWPDDDEPDEKIRWEIQIAPIISPRTPRGASIRLGNLDYFEDEPTDEMTDELRDAIVYFQTDVEDLEVNGELDEPTCARLFEMHDCESAASANSDATGASSA